MKRKWISVEDKKPELNEDVLIYNSHLDLFEVSYLSEMGTDRFVKQSDGRYIKEFDSFIMWANNNATHWQPLPSKP